MSWRELLKDNSLQKKKISFREVDRVLTKAHQSLKAGDVLIKKELPEPAFKQVYESMLLAARALIFSLGYKPRTIGSHVITIRFCELYLGTDFKFLVEKFKRMKRKRNYLIYGAGLTISPTEAKQALKNAKQFLKVIEEKINKIRKQKKLI